MAVCCRSLTTRTSSVLTPQIPGNYRNNYGPADYDVRNYFSLNYVWQVPIRRMMGGHGWAPLVDGWQLSGAIFARSGLPYTAIDSAFTGANNYFGSVYPNIEVAPQSFNCGKAAAFAGVGNGGAPCLTSSSPAAKPADQCVTVTQGNFGIPGCETAFGAEWSEEQLPRSRVHGRGLQRC